jgi:hypothetical protein
MLEAGAHARDELWVRDLALRPQVSDDAAHHQTNVAGGALLARRRYQRTTAGESAPAR